MRTPDTTQPAGPGPRAPQAADHRASDPRPKRKRVAQPASPSTAVAGRDVLAELGLDGGVSIELLQALHILTREGRLNQDSRRKLKQVLHLVQFIEPMVREFAGSEHSPVLVDHGAGKSYLGFVLYDLVLRPLGRGRMVGVEFREELVQRSQALAARQGFERMDFLPLAVAESLDHPALPPQVDIVTALHACDTATDDAIAFGLAKQTRAMALVPCCQAEVAAQMRMNKAFNLARTPLAELWRHPLHTREMGSHLTNVMRCLYLESQGYQVTVTELIGWEHSLKNELILARRTGQKKRSARQRLQQIAEEMGLQDWLARRMPLAVPSAADASDAADMAAAH